VKHRAIEQSPPQICLSFHEAAKPHDDNTKQVERRHVVRLPAQNYLATSLGIAGVAVLQRCERTLQNDILFDAHTQRIPVPNTSLSRNLALGSEVSGSSFTGKGTLGHCSGGPEACTT
jgi:hypothetical protein